MDDARLGEIEAKANAIISLLIEAHGKGDWGSPDRLAYVIRDMHLTEEALELALALASFAATMTIILGNKVSVSPDQLLDECITAHSKIDPVE